MIARASRAHLVMAAVTVALCASAALGADGTIAVTFDGLPGPPAALVSNDVPAVRAMTIRLLDGVKAHRIPVVGFVNEGKLFLDGETKAAAEHELGNHTYSHPDLNRLPLDAFEEDVIRGETVIRRLLAERKRPLR
jgi:peptidoglycan/xylan/chitin deacetylase (PgdA/CDA1 family)